MRPSRKSSSSPLRRPFQLPRFIPLAGLLLGLCLTAMTPPAAFAVETVVFEETDYVPLGALASRLAMSASWKTPGKELQLTGPSARLLFTAESREIRLNDMRIFLGEPVFVQGRQFHVTRLDYEKTLQPLLAPQAKIPVGAVRTIAIDPGHGGRDAGTRNPQLNLHEKDLTLAVAARLKRVLEQQGYKVILTRTDDSYVPLEKRSAMANAAGADLFISIHFNAVGKPEVHGTETYVLTPRTHRSTGQEKAADSDAAANPGNAHDHWNLLLGYLVQRQLLGDLSTFDRGLKRARFQVLRRVDCPAVLVEAGYLSNRAEASRIATSNYQNSLVRSLAIAINRYRQATEAIAAARR